MVAQRRDVLELGPRPWIIGHRGAAGSALENSLAAIRAGSEENADMIEVDVQLTSDHVPVLFHDWDLRRLAGRSEIVERTSLDRLRGIELPSPCDEGRASIPTLEEALEASAPGLTINLELKRRFHHPDDIARALRPTVEAGPPLLVSSFDWNLLAAFRRLWRGLPLAPIGRYTSSALLQAADELGAFSIHAHRELAPEVLEQNECVERPILAYTVNDPEEARHLVHLGVAGLFTDDPGRLREDVTRHV
jgi:glycerophosphoryl diester phosphodiesterase